jgi:hypothetical protein
MKEADSLAPRITLPDFRRRLVLSALLAAAGTRLIPFVAAQPAPALSAAPDSFIQISTVLTGQTSLDGALAARLYQALAADDAGFGDQHQKLLAYLHAHSADPAQLQQSLDAEKSSLATVPRRIVSAWYTGIVGDGERARCVAFEANLLNVLTADKLRPPSYSYGVYGSWAAKPV